MSSGDRREPIDRGAIPAFAAAIVFLPSIRIDISFIFRYSHAYYVEHKSLVADSVYDALYNELQALEDANPTMISTESPTHTVGAKIPAAPGVSTVKHSSPMLSLGNTFSEEEVYSFDERVQKGIGVRFALDRFLLC